jgi:basic membrane lipoprotein Med (substrate-binding protein (PBP1-ABC) superfamily)
VVELRRAAALPLALCVVLLVTAGAAAPATRFGLMLTCNTESADGGFNSMVLAALDNSSKTYPGRVLVSDLTCQDQSATEAAIAGGVSHVVSVGALTSMQLEQWGTALRFPGTRFTTIDYLFASPPVNVQSALFAEDEGSFLAGVLAGLVSTSKRIGALYGPALAPLRRFRSGFLNGVGAVCAECEVLSRHVNTFADAALGASVAEALVGAGRCDVVFAAAGGTGPGALLRAAALGAYVIGADEDQFLTVFGGNFSAGALGRRVVGSMVKRVDETVRRVVAAQVEQGPFFGGTALSMSLQNGGVELSPCHAACAALSAADNATLADVASALRRGQRSTNVDRAGNVEGEGFLWHRSRLGSAWAPVLAYGPRLPADLLFAAAATSRATGESVTYVFGGTSRDHPSGSAELWAFTVGANAWLQLTPGLGLVPDSTSGFPAARHKASLTALADGRLALFGGYGSNAEPLADLWLLSPPPLSSASQRTEEWRLVTAGDSARASTDSAPAPSARSGHAAASAGRELFLFGGQNAEGAVLSELWVFDTAAALWGRACGPCAPQARTGATLTPLYDSRNSSALLGLVLFGGAQASGAALADAWLLSPGSRAWRRLPNAPVARAWHGAVPLVARTPGRTLERLLAVVGGAVDVSAVPRRKRLSVDLLSPQLGLEWVSVASFQPNATQAAVCGAAGERTSGGASALGYPARYVPRSAFVAFSTSQPDEDAQDAAQRSTSDELYVVGGRAAAAADSSETNSSSSSSSITDAEVYLPSDSEMPEQYNRVSVGLNAFLIALFCAVVVLAAALVAWAVQNRANPVLVASQIPFLVLVALGCIVSTSTIVPATVDDRADEEELAHTGGYAPANAACMAMVWLYCTGFIVTFAPLFAKMWRVYRIFNNPKLRKLNISTEVLAGVCLSLLAIEWAVVGTMQAVSPLRYYRFATLTDEYGNVLESAGRCWSPDGLVFLMSLLAWHLIILGYGNFLAFRTRNIEDRFSESRPIAISLFANLQVLAVGVPVMFIAATSPVAFVVVLALVIVLNNLTVLLLIFTSKIYMAKNPPPMTQASLVHANNATSAWTHLDAADRGSYGFMSQPSASYGHASSLTGSFTGSFSSNSHYQLPVAGAAPAPQPAPPPAPQPAPQPALVEHRRFSGQDEAPHNVVGETIFSAFRYESGKALSPRASDLSHLHGSPAFSGSPASSGGASADDAAASPIGSAAAAAAPRPAAPQRHLTSGRGAASVLFSDHVPQGQGEPGSVAEVGSIRSTTSASVLLSEHGPHEQGEPCSVAKV